MRYLAIDFETNGRTDDPVLPRGAYPTQVSVTAYVPDTGEIVHLYDSYIRGAESLSEWVTQNTSMSLELLANAPSPMVVSEALKGLWQDGDILVAHNACFDLDTVLPQITADDHPFQLAPRICTMRTRWPTPGWPTLSALCAMLDVPYSDGHSATHDSLALARCVQAAWERKVQFSVERISTPEEIAASSRRTIRFKMPPKPIRLFIS
jgi:DNA polymerase III alpha subunit (gram-positive type)